MHRRNTSLLWAYAGVVAVVFAAMVFVNLNHQDPNAVLNPSGRANASFWQASSHPGVMSIRRVRVDNGPEGASTALEVDRRSRHASWSFALAGLRDPQGFFKPGGTYRMRAYVRDLGATGHSAGILLANGNFLHRPTTSDQYGAFSDHRWHLLQRTFTATSPAASDTALYIDLPLEGPLRWQITLASVSQVSLPVPPTTSSSPTVLSFDGVRGTPPSRRVWSHEVGGNGWGNDELQTYTSSVRNARLNGRGVLELTALRQDAAGPDGILRHFTSARLSTVGKLKVQPGSYVEATIRSSVADGVRPAFWLIGSNFAKVGWPACGELDVMEASRRSPALVRQTIHFPRKGNLSKDAPYGDYAPGGYTRLSSPRDAGWHRYGVYFDDKVVRFYVDGVPRLTLTRQQAMEKQRTWPFGQPQDIVLNLAVVQGARAGTFPVHMWVSNISIWHGGVPRWRTVFPHGANVPPTPTS